MQKHHNLDNKPVQDAEGNIVNKGPIKSLPPGVDHEQIQGKLLIRMGQLLWLTYDGINYMSDINKQTRNPRFENVYAKIKFWGEAENASPIFLRFENNLDGFEDTQANQYTYDIKCSEQSFEQYLDDMGALVIDFYDSHSGFTIGTAKAITNLFIKRKKRPADVDPLIDLCQTYAITLLGDHTVKIGEFVLQIKSQFQNSQQNQAYLQSAPNQYNQINNSNMQRQLIDLENDDTFEVNEQRARQLADQMENRLAGSLANRPASNQTYQGAKFTNQAGQPGNLITMDQYEQRPSNQAANSNIQNSNLNQKDRIKQDFDQRKQIDIEENEESAANFLEILKRGQKLKAQMEDALDDEKRTPWEQLHGVHNIPKTYVPPFLQTEFDKQIKDAQNQLDLNELEVMMDSPLIHQENQEINQQEVQQSQQDPQAPSATKQIMDMRYIYIRVGILQLDDQQLIQKCIDESFRLYVKIPLPDLHSNSVSSQNIQLNSYEVVSHNEYDFNSTSSFNFRINSDTLAQFVDSSMIFCLQDQTIVGEVKMNKLMLASQFDLTHKCELVQTVESKSKTAQAGSRGRKKGLDQDTAELEQRVIGSISFQIKLQAENEENEARRNFQLRMQQVQEQAAKQELERAEMAKKKLQYVMEQAPVFGQLYIHVEKLGHADNIGKRSDQMVRASLEREEQDEVNNRDPEVVIMDATQENMSSSLNARATGTDEDGIVKMAQKNRVDNLERAPNDQSPLKDPSNQKKLIQSKRNFYVQYKAFPNLEPMKTGTVWQTDADAVFNYRANFPVMMTPETLEKMEKFVFILELWDQVSPSVSEFLGLVKVPLAPITYSMKTTDEEIFSLNFMADQFCLYPMIISDGFLPIYSPAKGENIGHLKVTLAMGSPIQINRLIAKEQEEEKRIAAEAERIRLLEAQRQIEQELREQERLQREQEKREQEERKQKEDQQKEANPLDSLLGLGVQTSATKKGAITPAKLMGKNIAAVLRQSLNSQLSADYDQRERSLLNCLRKLFEEARSQNVEELNGDGIFKDDVKDFEGKVHKDEVIYTFLNHESFSLTRSELANINQLMLDINRDDQGQIDVDELNFSYVSYQKYYEIIEQRIVDLFDKFRISITKKFDSEEALERLIADIESRSQESKIAFIELRSIIEDQHGVQIRDTLFHQLLQYFDLDRDQQLYITSFCDYIKNPTTTTINFFKINKAIIAAQISNYIKNSIETNTDCIVALEEEFKKEIWKHLKQVQQEEVDPEELEIVPADILLKEKINAKLFQYKLKRQGIPISLWEVFTFFDFLNTSKANMYFEPQRYHQLMFGSLFEFVTNQPYSRGQVNKPPGARSRSRTKGTPSNDRSDQASVSKPMTYDIGKAGYKKYPPDEEANLDEGYWHRNDLSDTEDPRQPYRQIKHVFEIKVHELKNIPVLNKFICQMQNQSENIENQYMNEDMRTQKHLLSNKYIQNVAVKYSFPLDEDEVLESDYLQLNKDALEAQGVYNYNVSMDTVHTYVIGKDDSIKKVLELCQSRGGAQASGGYDQEHQVLNSQHARREELFNISIALYQDNREFIVGNAHLPIEDLIDTIEQYESKSGTYSRKDKKTRLTRTIFLYGTSYSQRENCIIGKLVLDLQYSQEKLILSKKEAQAYALQMEQKDNTVDEFNQSPFSCFMHRETYVNRKIPLNAKLSVLIDRVSNLKESIENIEHFARIQHAASNQADSQFDKQADNYGLDTYQNNLSNLSMSSMVHGKNNMQHLDRRRVLKHILKNGLNLIVTCSVFEEDNELAQKFETAEQAKTLGSNGVAEPPLGNLSRYKTRMLFNSLNPVFGEVFEMNLQMNTKIFEYLKNKRAVFEVRHYIIESQKQKIDKMRRTRANAGDFNDRIANDEIASERTILDDDVEQQCDFLVLGYVRVPLIQLITKNNGVDGDFTIYDEFKQSMGSLKLRITLNHFNSQRPLYSTSNRIADQIVPGISNNRKKQTIIEQSIKVTNQIRTGQLSGALQSGQKIILGLDFIELLLKNRRQLTQQSPGHVSRFFLKYKLLNRVYQTRFLSSETGNSLSALNILLDKLNLQKLSIQKTNFIEIDVADQNLVEQAFGKPLQIQLWYKVESVRTYEKPVQEKMIGQFFVELNELPQIVNNRLKSPHNLEDTQPGQFQVFEGYFSLHDAVKDVLSADRLAMRLYLFKRDETNSNLNQDNLTEIFNTYRPKIEEIISLKLDSSGKGYTDSDDLIQAVQDVIPDEYLADKLIWFIKSSLQFKSVDKVFYSPLFGLPPPFFKYAKKFDQWEILNKINEELEQLDSGEHGLVPVNLFRNCLQDELNIKNKIVDDFVNGIRDTNIENSNAQSVTANVKEHQTLDVNLITNSLKTSHIDYVVMLRKLAQFIHQNTPSNNAASAVHTRIIDSIQQHQNAQNVTMYFEIDNGMRLKNPMSSNEPPTAFVSMKPCFQYKESQVEQFVQTSEIKSNSYPTWNYRSKNFTMPLNRHNQQFLEEGGVIKFEVFHKASGFGHTDMAVRESNHLIGVAFVPLKPLIEGNGRTRLTGLFDVVSRNAIYNQSVTSLKSIDDKGTTMGKIKVSVSTNLNIRKIMDTENSAQIKSLVNKNIGLSSDIAKSTSKLDENIKKNFSFGREEKTQQNTSLTYQQQNQQIPDYQSIKSKTNDYQQEVGQEHLEIGDFSSKNFKQLDESVRNYDQNLQTKTEQELDLLHLSNMNDLDDLTKKLKQSMAVLNVTVPEDQRNNESFQNNDQRVQDSPEISQIRRQNFGHATFKTDAQQVMLSQQLDDFRQTNANVEMKSVEHLKKEKQQIISNPFASYNENAFAELGDLDRADVTDQYQVAKNSSQNYSAPEIRPQEVSTPELHRMREGRSGDQNQQIATNEDRSDGTAAITNVNQVIGYEAEGSRPGQAGAPGSLGTSTGNGLKQHQKTYDYDDIDGIDLKEMDRIQKILKQQPLDE